jgi:FkbM family methyltransferase
VFFKYREDILVLEKLLTELPMAKDSHERGSLPYNSLYDDLKEYIYSHYAASEGRDRELDFGNITIAMPYFSMGNCNTLNLFDLDEIILFSFYWHNRDRYSSAIDIGANIGAHSIFMDRCGFSVSCYEPDHIHFDELTRNISLNGCENVKPFRVAVSDNNGVARFIRILDNTTSNHIQGSKDNVYGPTEDIEVPTVNINDIIDGVDLVKIDAEGHEDTILEELHTDAFDSLDMVLEVSSTRSAEIIFNKFSGNCNLLSQKLNWNQAESVKDIPVSYKEGSLFISRRFDSFYGD